MATWPTLLPDPMKDSASCVLGSNAIYRKTQSGRREVTRFGSAAPDNWKLLLRLRVDQYEVFNNFYRQDLNLGVNWFSANWISEVLGYTDHLARIVSFPERRVSNLVFTDLNLNVLIKKSSACPADSTWPPEGW